MPIPISINLYDSNYRINLLVSISRSSADEFIMAPMVPGYILIIPFQDVTKQHQQQQQPNRLLIRLIPAVINLRIIVMIICLISTLLHISHHFITLFLQTNQPPFGSLKIQQPLVVDQQPTYLLTI